MPLKIEVDIMASKLDNSFRDTSGECNGLHVNVVALLDQLFLVSLATCLTVFEYIFSVIIVLRWVNILFFSLLSYFR